MLFWVLFDAGIVGLARGWVCGFGLEPPVLRCVVGVVRFGVVLDCVVFRTGET